MTNKSNRSNGKVQALTIGHLAKAAHVGVETIRYYQGRGLLPVPEPTGRIRYYGPELVDRIGFIKRSQGLGFSLDEVTTLLALADGLNRRAVQSVAVARLDQIHRKLDDLARMQKALDGLLEKCIATGKAYPCPIIGALMHASG